MRRPVLRAKQTGKGFGRFEFWTAGARAFPPPPLFFFTSSARRSLTGLRLGFAAHPLDEAHGRASRRGQRRDEPGRPGAVSISPVAGDGLRAAVVACSRAADSDFRGVCEAADELRAETNGDIATYVINRNINYTNICGYRCSFARSRRARCKPKAARCFYDMGAEEVVAPLRSRRGSAERRRSACRAASIPSFDRRDLCRDPALG